MKFKKMANNADKLKQHHFAKREKNCQFSSFFLSRSVFTSMCTKPRIENTLSNPADDGGSVEIFIAKVDIPSSSSPVIFKDFKYSLALQIPGFLNRGDVIFFFAGHVRNKIGHNY